MKFIQRLGKCRTNPVETRQLFNQVLPGRKTRPVNKHPYRACIFRKIHTYVEKYAKIRIKYGKNLPERHRMSNIRRKFKSKPLFVYVERKAYAEGLLDCTAYSVCMYIHTPTAYDRTTQP
jgi:hypothetical protein